MIRKHAIGLVLAGVCLLAQAAVAGDSAVTPTKSITIVAFGDSITAATRQAPDARWPDILRRELHDRFPHCSFKVINAGVGGNTSREGLRRIEQDVLKHAPDFVLVEFGNDATPVPARHVSFEEYGSNLLQIKVQVAARNNGRLVLLTFPPIIDPWHSKYKDEFYRRNGGQDAYQEHYRNITRRLAREHDVPLADIDKELRDAISRRNKGDYILRDGVHLTDQGNRVVADVVLATLIPEISKFLRLAGPSSN